MGRTLGDLAFETHEIRVPQNLQPGVSDGQLDELAARLDVDLPAPVATSTDGGTAISTRMRPRCSVLGATCSSVLKTYPGRAH